MSQTDIPREAAVEALGKPTGGNPETSEGDSTTNIGAFPIGGFSTNGMSAVDQITPFADRAASGQRQVLPEAASVLS